LIPKFTVHTVGILLVVIVLPPIISSPWSIVKLTAGREKIETVRSKPLQGFENAGRKTQQKADIKPGRSPLGACVTKSRQPGRSNMRVRNVVEHRFGICLKDFGGYGFCGKLKKRRIKAAVLPQTGIPAALQSLRKDKVIFI
jgi:hypothetical protein